MRRRFSVLSLVALSALSAIARADDAPGAAAALRAASAPLSDRDYAKAATALRDMRGAFPGSKEALEAWVLEARALLLAGRPQEALDAATAFLKANGDAAWAGRMKATTADAYAALHAPKDEAAALRARGEFLTGPDYRAKLAALYVKLGDEDFDGRDGKDDLGRPVKNKDFAKAIEAYMKGLDVGVDPKDAIRVRARVALAFEEVRNFSQAAAVWDFLMKDFPEPSPADGETWLVGRARARLRGDWPTHAADARKDLRDALAAYPKGAKHLEILRLSAEERFAASGGPEGELAFEEGVSFLRRAMSEHRDDPAAPAVERALAEAYAGRGAWQKAAAEWRGLVERFPNDAAAPEWRNALAESLANAGKWDEAVAEWKAFLGAFPNHALWQTVQARIPAARFAKGQAAKDEGDVDGAIAAWRAFAEEYATDARAPEALVEAALLLRGRKDFDGAIAGLRGVTGRYAGSPQSPRAALLVAQILEDDQSKLEDAVKEYEALIKAHGGTGEANEAQARLQRLRGKHLEVRGERVVGSKDASTLRVVTRNMPSLKVRVYKLGLEDYFRRKQTVAGVENVQVEIVKPDVTSEWKLDPYVPYALVQADRPVPTTGPGAYVVVAGDDDLTSTTLLLVSDIETVFKTAAGRQVFVWARNRATGEPVENARVLASDGSTVFADGKTDKDGVYRLDTDRTARRVLVLSGDHAASSELEPGQVFAEGWQTKVYVHTDRPVYRPGQTVKWRGIFRRADGGAYRNTAGAKGVAVLIDARGQEVERKDVVASALGTFDGAFALDGEAPLGVWSVRIDVDDRSYPGLFTVLEYRKPEFTVSVEPAKPSYATGEEVKATIRLRYTFGGPVSGAPVRWEVVRVPRDFTPSAVNDYSWYYQDPEAIERAKKAAREAPRGVLVSRGESKTDDTGVTTVSFPTTERDEDAEYVVTASAIDVTRRFVTDEGRIPVVRRDHWAVVTTDKRVYRPKQEVRATLVTVDANQTPVARSGTVILQRLKRTATQPLPPGTSPRPIQQEDKRGLVIREEEIDVQTIPVTTDAKGRAEVRLVLPGPGTFRVRYKATDARGALVTALSTIDVAGEAEDLTKDARLVAAKETYTEGEKAEVLLQSPVSKVKALLTFEGEKVLAYRLIDVTGPSTVLDVPIDAAYAPNVTMKVAIPGPDRLFEAEDEIVVLRYLDVKVVAAKATAAPGEDVSFDVTTTDAAGNPVAAEIGLSVVDDALYGVAPDRAPAIRPFFYDRKRVNRVVTASSVGFKTYGATRETNKDVLANAEAQGGDAQRIFAQSALRLAREAIDRGDMDGAVAQALLASQADPQSWDARALLSDLRARPEAQDAMKRLFETESASKDIDRLRKQAETSDEKRPAARAIRQVPGVAVPATPAPAPPRGGEWDKSADRFANEPTLKDAEAADHNESGADMPTVEDFAAGLLDGPAEGKPGDPEKSGVGSGGGAGGFKGRKGGRRNLTAHGGGAAKKNERAEAFSWDDASNAPSPGPGGDLSGFSLPRVTLKGEEAITLHRAYISGYEIASFDAPEITPSLRKAFADTAAWEPHVATDAAGKASVKVKLPDNLTRWRATARGVGGDSLVGEGKGFVVSRRDVLVRIDAPRFLTQGDEAVVPTAIHNDSAGEATGTARLKADGVTLSGEDASVTVPAGGRKAVDRTISAKDAGAVRLEAEFVSSAGGDKAEATLGTIARGIRKTDGRSGVVSTTSGGTTETFLEIPEGSIPAASRLTIVLYPGTDAAILDALGYLDLFPYACVEQTVHRFLPATWARAALLASGSPDAKRLDDLDQAVRLFAARLKNLANADGSYGWFRGGQGDCAMTALALLGLNEAQRLGVPGASEAIDRTAAALKRILRQAPDDRQALGHWALAAVDRIDEEAYAITFRRRNEELSVPGLSWMTFAALAAGRPFDAEDLTRLILSRRVDENDTTRWAGKKEDCFLPSERLATALAVRALVEGGAATDAAERGMRWLLSNRPDAAFGSTMETAAFVGAASSWIAKSRPGGYGGTIKVLVDGAEARSVLVKPGVGLVAKDRRFSLDATKLAAGRHTLAFRLEGQGEVRFAARLDTVEASDALPADEHGVKVERLYLDPEIPAVEGAELPTKPGYEVLRPSARPRVEAKSRDRAATGERLLVRVTVTAPRDLQYVLVEDPLPAGFEVLSETQTGAFDWQERRDDRQVFFLSSVKAGTSVLTYAIQAVHLGSFTALPTRVVAMYLPEVNGRAAGHRLTVGKEARGGDAETTPTPDEVYAEAAKLLKAKKWKEAAAVLAALRDKNPLRDEIVEEIEAALLRCAIETKDAKEIVRAREELIRRNPARLPNDLSSARAVAAAYDDVGGHAVASTLFRDLVARAFGSEVAWSQLLAARGREVDALAYVGDALRAYPVTNATASAALARATRYRELRRPSGGTGKAGAPMDEESLAALRSYVAHYAESSLQAPASYQLIEALRRARDLDGAVIEATAFPKRFPDSPFVDDALWFLTDSRLQKFEAAPSKETGAPVLEAATRLTAETFKRADGVLDVSEFRPRAWHAIGRVRHVLGDLDGAIDAYRQASSIEDAREAYAYLTETRLELVETATAGVLGAAKFPMRYRNVGEVKFKAYPVDLQTLFAVRRTLEGLNRIDLSGIRPAQEWTATPADGKDHAWHDTEVELPAGKDAAGVFLVVAKAGDLEASTVVIKTDLKVVLQSVGEKVRVNVTGADGKGVRGAYVTVSDGTRIKARGLTDGRGVFEAPGVGSKPFVVVSMEDRYAIAR